MVKGRIQIAVVAAFSCLLIGAAIGQPTRTTRLGFDPGPRLMWLSTLDASVEAARLEAVVAPVGKRGEASPMLEGEKSRGAAFLRSLLVPGWGQRYAGSRKASLLFFASELLLWSGHISQHFYGEWLRDDYKLLAATHAGVDPQGKPIDFFVDVGNYSSLDDYNSEQLRRRSVASLYPRQAGYDWQWDSETHRRNYRRLRVRSDEAFNRAIFFVGGVFANHLISAVHSVWAVHRYNSRLASANSRLRFGIEPGAAGRSVLLRVSQSF